MTELSTGVGLAAAFGAGLASFLSPCVLPLIPSYLTYITGLSLEDVSKSRRASLVHALLFVLGFTIIFVAFGAIATGFGRLLLSYRYAISRVGGILVIIFGLYLIGALNITAFTRGFRCRIRARASRPFKRGICTSINTRSNGLGDSVYFSTASSPLTASTI